MLRREVPGSSPGIFKILFRPRLDRLTILFKAEESTERWRAGKPLSDLDGVPIGIKDQIDIKGLTVRNGLPFPESNPAKSDGAIIEKIKNGKKIMKGP